jgi:hypothetical protein
MQPHNSNDQRASEGDPDGGRDLKLRPLTDPDGLALASLPNDADWAVHIATLNLKLKMDNGVIRTVSSDIPNTPGWWPAMAAVDAFVARNLPAPFATPGQPLDLCAKLKGSGGLDA